MTQKQKRSGPQRLGDVPMTRAEAEMLQELLAGKSEEALAKVNKRTVASLVRVLKLIDQLERDISRTPWLVAKNGVRRPSRSIAALESARRQAASLRRQLGLTVPDAQRRQRQSAVDDARTAMRVFLEDFFDAEGLLLARPDDEAGWSRLVEHSLERARAGELPDYDGPC